MKEERNVIVRRVLTVQLTDDNLISAGMELVDKLEEIREAEDSKKAAADRWKKEIADLDGQASELERKIREKTEGRTIECRWDYHWLTALRELVRLDNGEVIEKESIPDDDIEAHRQGELDLVESREPLPMALECEDDKCAHYDVRERNNCRADEEEKASVECTRAFHPGEDAESYGEQKATETMERRAEEEAEQSAQEKGEDATPEEEDGPEA